MICRAFEIFLFSIIESPKSSLSYLMLMKFRILADVSLISYWYRISTWTSNLFMNSLRKAAYENWLPPSWLWVSIFTFLNVHISFSSFATIWKEHSVRRKKTFRFSVLVLFLIFWPLVQQKYTIVLTSFLLIFEFLIITAYFWSLMNSLTFRTSSKISANWFFKESDAMISSANSNLLIIYLRLT